MSEPEQFGGGEENPAAERFFSGALERIRRFMLGLGAAGTVAVWAVYGWRLGLGFLAGAIVAWANFFWLEQGVEALSERVAGASEPVAPVANTDGESQADIPMGEESESPGPRRRITGAGIAARFLVRYALIALGAYVIFKSSPASLYGFLGGMFLAVGALLCEAGYEVYGALRRGF